MHENVVSITQTDFSPITLDMQDSTVSVTSTKVVKG